MRNIKFVSPATAAYVANALRVRGIKVLSHQEGDDSVDGEVTVAERVAVQVPTFGGPCVVVTESADGETFGFGDDCHDMNSLEAAVRAALQDESGVEDVTAAR